MRLKTEIWVQALIMRASVGGAMATVFNRGDKDAGDCLVRVNNLDGSSSLFHPFLGLKVNVFGKNGWKVEQIIKR